MKTIYFVHDQEETPSARKNFLEMAGYRVKLMTSGRELFSALQEENPALVLMDVLIEGRNGFEVCREVSSRYLNRRFPIVLASRIYTARVFQEEAARAGAQDYMTLPINLEEMVKRVNQAIVDWGRKAQVA
jgi:CheY-like chemotaxis protein